MESTRLSRPQVQLCTEPDDEPAADVVELLLMVLLGLPLMVGFSLAAVQFAPWLLSSGMSFPAAVGICIAGGLVGASLFGLVAMACRCWAQAMARKRRGG